MNFLLKISKYIDLNREICESTIVQQEYDIIITMSEPFKLGAYPLFKKWSNSPIPFGAARANFVKQKFRLPKRQNDFDVPGRIDSHASEYTQSN